MTTIVDNDYFETKYDMVHMVARRYCIQHRINKDYERDDVYQTAYELALELIRKKEELPDMDENEFDAYLCRSVINALNDLCSDKTRNINRAVSVPGESPEFKILDESEDTVRYQGLLIRDIIKITDEETEHMPERTGLVIKRGLRYMILCSQGYPYARIAEIEGASEDAIKQAVHRTRRALEKNTQLTQKLLQLLLE